MFSAKRKLNLFLFLYLFFSYNKIFALECINYLEQFGSFDQKVLSPTSEASANSETINNPFESTTNNIRKLMLELRLKAPALIGSGNAFAGIALQTTLLTESSLDSFISFFDSFPDTELEKTSLEHLIIVSTTYRLKTPKDQLQDLIVHFKTTSVDRRLGKLQRLFALQTALILNEDLDKISRFFYEFGNTPWAPRSAYHSLIVQAAYLTKFKKQVVINFFRNAPWIKSPWLAEVDVDRNKIAYSENTPELSNTSRAFLTQLIFLLSSK